VPCEKLVSPTLNAMLLLFGVGETNCLQIMLLRARQDTGDEGEVGGAVTHDGLMSSIYSCELECKVG